MIKCLEEIREFIREAAKRKSLLDKEDFNIYDWSGGNVDDAFSLGLQEGETLLAQEIEAILNNYNL